HFLQASWHRCAGDERPKTSIVLRDVLSCFPKKINEKVWCLIHADAMKLRGLELWRKTLPDGDGQVLGSWNAGQKLRHFFVQETMIEGVQHFPVQNFLELFEINNEAGTRIHFAFHRDLEGV